MLFRGLIFDLINGIEIAHEAIEVESATDDELFGNLMSDIVGSCIVVLQFSGFEKHRSHADGVSSESAQVRFELMNGKSGVHDVFDDDDISLIYHLLQGHNELELSRGGHSPIGADADERHLAAHIFECTDEVCGKDKSTVEHDDKERLFALVVGTNLFRHLLHILRDLLGCDKFFKMITLFFNRSHIAEIENRYTGSA